MDEIHNNVSSCDSSDNETLEKDIVIESEQLLSSASLEEMKESEECDQQVGEKRVRQEEEEEEIVEEDDFVTVIRQHKRPNRKDSFNNSLTGGEKNTEEEKCIICVTGKETLPKQFGMAKLLQSCNISNIVKMVYKSAFRVLIHFENKECATKMMNCEKITNLGYRIQMTDEVSLCYGTLRQVDLETDEKEILENVSCESEIISVKRLKKLSDSGEWIDSETSYDSPEGLENQNVNYTQTKTYKDAVIAKTNNQSSSSAPGNMMEIDSSEKKKNQQRYMPKKKHIETSFIRSDKEKEIHNTQSEITSKETENTDKTSNTRSKLDFYSLYRKVRDICLSVDSWQVKLQELAKILFDWNARSLMPKRNEFELLIAQEKAHIALVTETWLEPDTHFNVSGYNTLRRDRPDGYGGLAILIHKSIKVQQCSTYINNPGIEIMSVNLVNCNEIKNIVLVYCPSSVRTCLSDWEQIFSLFSSKCIIAGDFNGHHATWSSKTDARGIQLYDTALDSGFISLNDGNAALVDGVAQNTSPDVTFVSTDLSVLLGWRIINENLGSDHLFIKISYKYNSSLNPVVTIKKRNFKLAKWSNYSEALENSLIQTVVPRNVQSLYDNFIEQLNKAADENIPFIKLNSNPSNGFRPKSYWNPNLSRLVAQRRLALKIFRRNPTPNNLSVLEHKTEVAKKAISQEKSKDWRNYCSSVNEQTSSSEMWKRMGWIKGRVSPRLSVSNEHKVELLCSLAPDYVYPKQQQFNSNNAVLEDKFTLQEMINCFKRKDTAPGTDGITYSLIFYLSSVKEIEVASSYPLFMFTLRTWVTNINVNEIIACDLESVKSPKGSYDCNVLKYEVTKELCSKYYGWFTIFTDGSKGVEGR
ncbi:hypothetical protein SFRURICE_019628, partial [Spodoptera frugiperda]